MKIWFETFGDRSGHFFVQLTSQVLVRVLDILMYRTDVALRIWPSNNNVYDVSQSDQPVYTVAYFFFE